MRSKSIEKEEFLENGEEPERFYHGFVLGLIVELQNKYIIASNRESGFFPWRV